MYVRRHKDRPSNPERLTGGSSSRAAAGDGGIMFIKPELVHGGRRQIASVRVGCSGAADAALKMQPIWSIRAARVWVALADLFQDSWTKRGCLQQDALGERATQSSTPAAALRGSHAFQQWRAPKKWTRGDCHASVFHPEHLERWSLPKAVYCEKPRRRGCTPEH